MFSSFQDVWLGYVRRMDPGWIPKDLVYRELPEGVRPAGRPFLLYKDICKRDLKLFGIDLNTWERWLSSMQVRKERGRLRTLETTQWQRGKQEERKWHVQHRLPHPSSVPAVEETATLGVKWSGLAQPLQKMQICSTLIVLMWWHTDFLGVLHNHQPRRSDAIVSSTILFWGNLRMDLERITPSLTISFLLKNVVDLYCFTKKKCIFFLHWSQSGVWLQYGGMHSGVNYSK